MIDIKNVKHAAIITHIRPDGDAFGSMLGLKHALNKIGIKCDCYCDSPVPFHLSRMPGAQTVKTTPLEGDYDLIIAVDCADEVRLGNYKDAFLKHPNTYNIDHHLTNTKYAEYNVINDDSSTCEVVLRIIKALGIELDSTIAECLYTGISTDTGNFSHGNTTTFTHLAAAELLKYNVDVETVSMRMFKEMSIGKLGLIKDAIESFRLFSDNQIALIYISLDTLQKNGLEFWDTEGIIDYAINIRGVMIGICMTESSKNAFKVSLRSKKGYNVAQIAAMFGGGGHVQAAGCMINGTLEDAIEKIVRQCAIVLEG